MHSTMRRFWAHVEWDPTEQDWVASALGFDHLFVYGETREEALTRIRQAVAACLASGIGPIGPDLAISYPDRRSLYVEVDVQQDQFGVLWPSRDVCLAGFVVDTGVRLVSRN
jgi:predicted RNase H-like HicB family nuclease